MIKQKTSNCPYINLESNHNAHDNSLIFDNNFNEPLDNYYKIISKYSILRFYHVYEHETLIIKRGCFNRPIILGINLREVYFGVYFNQFLTLSKNLVVLSFLGCFNKSLELSKNLAVLKTGFGFHQNIFLTKNLKDITFEERFNKGLFLSKNLLKISLSDCFNHPLIFTKKLIFILTGFLFNQHLELPKYCQRLIIYSSMTQPILTKHIKELKISSLYVHPIVFETKIHTLNFQLCIKTSPDVEIEQQCAEMKFLDNIPNNLISEIIPSISDRTKLNNLPSNIHLHHSWGGQIHIQIAHPYPSNTCIQTKQFHT